MFFVIVTYFGLFLSPIAVKRKNMSPCPHLNVHVPVDLGHGSFRETRAQVEAVTVLRDNMTHDALVVERREGHVGKGGLSC